MAKYCGTVDTLSIYEKYTSLVAGTDSDDIITDASAWVYAVLQDFHALPDTALPASGTSSDFWIRRATASESVYLASSRRFIPNQEEPEGFWRFFHDDAVGILQEIRDGIHILVTDVGPGERGIGPAEPVENEAGTGTVSAPSDGMCWSNNRVEGDYYLDDEIPRTYLLEVDGAGSTVADQTFKFKSNKYGSSWDSTGIEMQWGFVSIGADGVKVRFEDRDDFAAGQRWEVDCHPQRGQSSAAISGDTYYLDRG